MGIPGGAVQSVRVDSALSGFGVYCTQGNDLDPCDRRLTILSYPSFFLIFAYVGTCVRGVQGEVKVRGLSKR